MDSGDPEALKKAITPKTKAVYAESIGNPKLDVADLKAIAQIAHTHGIPFVLDNTVLIGLLRPIDHGVDIVVYSATKFIGGHGTSLGGVIVDSGKFDWTNGKFPLISGPDPELPRDRFRGGLKRGMGNIAYIIKARVTCCGIWAPALSPFNSFLFLQGLETLHLRHAETFGKRPGGGAAILKKHPKVSWVNLSGTGGQPGVSNGPKKYLPKGAGAMWDSGSRGGWKRGRSSSIPCSSISHLANIGDAKSLAIHPAITTHSQLSPEEQLATGVTPDLYPALHRH